MSVLVVPYDPFWKNDFIDESRSIQSVFAISSLILHHIGSTAIPGILAKPTIDILGAVPHLRSIDSKVGALQKLGYEALGSHGINGRRYFRKTNALGERSHHLHVFVHGSPHIERYLAFRDYLIAKPEVATEYSALKEKLSNDKTSSRGSYEDGKDPFVRNVQEKALEWFRAHKKE